MKKLLIVLMAIFVIGVMAGIAEAEDMKLFEFDIEPEMSLLYNPADGVVDYGMGATLFYLFDRTVYVGGVYVPGENLSTSKGEGRNALYGPKAGADILKSANKLGIPVELPLKNLRLGTAWLCNLEGGIHCENYPRIELSYSF